MSDIQTKPESSGTFLRDDVFDVMTNRQAKLTNRVADVEKAHDELEKSVIELATLVQDGQMVVAELTKHLIALAEKEEK
tara:strand:+ start:728 stop:964 length:237 start_codon:yes stop_codon:yes gene_type:complete